VALGIERKITWYLAVDQYGYLAFAHDLAQGRVFHDWPPLRALAAKLPQRVDVLVQTYVWDNGRLYCRYAPGFPLLLAGWLRLFGDDGAHYLNPTVFLALLALVLAFQRRLLHSRWRALAGMALVVLFPSFLYLWSLTLVRDLSALLAGFLGLFLLLPAHGRRLRPRRVLGAALALGYAGSIRPDAVLYLIPGGLLAGARWQRERAAPRRVLAGLAAGALGLGLGLAPLLAYNWMATGNPLRPTQGMEVQGFLEAAPPPPPMAAEPRTGYPPGAWRGGVWGAVQGGGLRLAHLPRTLPGNVGLLRGAYGDVLLGVAVLGALLALVQRRLLFLAAVPYCVVALLFFSCWARPDTRYLAGIYLFMPMLVVEGVLGSLDLVRRLVRGGRRLLGQQLSLAAGALLLAVAVAVRVPPAATALPTLVVILCGVGVIGLAAASLWPHRRVTAVAAPLLALLLFVLSGIRTSASLDRRASFQRPAVLRAQARFSRAVEPKAVVITTEEVGRPAENIDYYSGVAHALYLTDLSRWGLPVYEAARLLAEGGFMPYLFIQVNEPGRDRILAPLQKGFKVDLVADVKPREAIEYFVAAAFHSGVRMELFRLGPKG
jgi:hypothetical protein